jgi:nucleotide-binding universal stress UspA family protein
MGIKDILVHIDHRATCPARLDLAIRLAQSHAAHLAGIYVTELPFFALRHNSIEADRQGARDLFLERTLGVGLDAEYIEVDSATSGFGMIETINAHAYYRDLVILGQNDSAAGDRSVPADLPERAVLGAGRPELVIPYAGEFETVGKRVLLAWRFGPESARALNDAMPLLQQARSVQILSVKTPGGDGESGPVSGDLVKYLARHGVQAETEHIDPFGLSVGDLLLNRAADLGSDLLVMGAFSQSLRGIPGLGEVGRHLLKCMTIPVLMSH